MSARLDLNKIAETLLQLRGLRLAERRRIVVDLPKLTGRQIYALPPEALDIYLRSLPPKLRARAWNKWHSASYQIHIEEMPEAERKELEDFASHFHKPQPFRRGSVTSETRLSVMQAQVLEVGDGDHEAGYRILAKKMHPDCGGTHEQMTQLNAAIRALRIARTAA